MQIYNSILEIPFPENSFNPKSSAAMNTLREIIMGNLRDSHLNPGKRVYEPTICGIELLSKMYVSSDGYPCIKCQVIYGYVPKN